MKISFSKSYGPDSDFPELSVLRRASALDRRAGLGSKLRQVSSSLFAMEKPFSFPLKADST